ncbi:MAG: M50 family metallopeptidase [Candidatus Diapherotrites archaeon]|nr:M50 family metallopeptidase [Candidatus Diapherotrites archaeon]
MSSLKLGKIFGISIELHSTFIIMALLFLVFIAAVEQANFFQILLLWFFLFFSVFVHELFHSIVAISKGIKVSKITLLPIGGLSVTEELPEKPIDEFLIAIAGPFFNFLAIIAALAIAAAMPLLWPGQLFTGTGIQAEEFYNAILQYPLFAFFWVNFMLGAFNLFVPALPLDGGRVLRALLSTRLGYYRATMVATGISRIISGALFIIGFAIGDLILAVIGVFIFLGAGQETEMVSIRHALEGIDLRKIVSKKNPKIKPETTVGEAVKKMLEKKQTTFLVDTAKPGFVTVEILEHVKKSEQDFLTVAEISRPVPQVNVSMKPEKALLLMLSRGSPFVQVLDKNRVVGILSEEDLQKVIRIQKAVRQLG